MKITKQGIAPQDVVQTAKCHNCKTEYEFYVSDPGVKVTESPDPRDQGSKEAKFQCQVCKNEVSTYVRTP